MDKKCPAGGKGASATKEDVLVSLVPELFEEAELRYAVLKQVSLQQPVGRRTIAEAIGSSERVVRSQATHLEEAGLVVVSPTGIRITARGERLLVALAEYFRKRQSVMQREIFLAEALGMSEVSIVRGDSARNPAILANVAQEGALLVAKLLRDGMVVAVSGGTTLALLAKALPANAAAITTVPARGGFGEHLETQANVVAAQIARKTGGDYRMLHVPDGFSPEIIALMRREDASLREVEELIHRADVLVLGIGEAMQMAERRQLPEDGREQILQGGAVGEALGYYADPMGKVVYCRHNVGVTLAELASVPETVIVAGGSHKAQAILAMARAGVRGRLVTDEGAADAMRRILTKSTSYKEEKKWQQK